jgi:cytochrome c oxidase subunit I+III
MERTTYVTSVLEAKPQARAFLPYPSLLPFWLALAVTTIFVGFLPFIGFDVELLLIPFAAVFVYVLVIAWTWPETPIARTGAATDDDTPGFLPNVVTGHVSPLWWGIIWLIVIEIVVLGSLLFGYYYLRLGLPEWPPLEAVPPAWPPAGFPDPPLLLPIIAGALLLASAIPIFLGNRFIRRGNARSLLVSMVIATALALASLVVSLVHYMDRPFHWTDHAYASIVWVLGGYIFAHVVVLILFAAPMLVLEWRGYFDAQRHAPVQSFAMFWYYVLVAWVVYFVTVYVTPYGL